MRQSPSVTPWQLPPGGSLWVVAIRMVYRSLDWGYGDMIVILSGAEGSLRFLDKLGMTGVAWNDRGWLAPAVGWFAGYGVACYCGTVTNRSLLHMDNNIGREWSVTIPFEWYAMVSLGTNRSKSKILLNYCPKPIYCNVERQRSCPFNPHCRA